jgi:uncharacterized protein (DUF169 family)
MNNHASIERQLTDNLHLTHRPVAVAFLDAPPPGVAKFAGVQPSGCSFWKLAADGLTFYTVPSDHYNCPIGSYTHNIDLPADRAHELEQTLGLMAKIGYVRMEEVAGIPRLSGSPAAVVYAPLGDAPVDPDVVLFWGRPGQLMMLQEAAIRAGAASPLSVLPRPTCMALPAAMTMGTVGSTGCIGNRVYTEMDDGEMYVVVPGKDLARVAGEAQTISAANAQLLTYHRDRRRTLTRTS